MYMNIIEVKDLSKKYKELLAVNGITFNVRQREVFGFLGPNGAGKSTTISMLATLISPSGGEALINGFNINTQRDEVRKSIGLVFQDSSLDDRLTANENLCFHADLYHVPRGLCDQRTEEVLKLVDLWERRNSIVKTFSGGMKRRLEIARGLIHQPKVLFLDEPTLGLDPQTRYNIWEYIFKLKKSHEMTIFMTTHYMNEAEYCDRIAIIDHGKIIALDTPANLKRMVGGDIITILSAQKDDLKNELKDKYDLEAKEDEGALKIEVSEGEKFLPRLFNELDSKIDSIEMRKPTLEDVFLNMTGHQIREENASDRELMRNHRRKRR